MVRFPCLMGREMILLPPCRVRNLPCPGDWGSPPQGRPWRVPSVTAWQVAHIVLNALKLKGLQGSIPRGE